MKYQRVNGSQLRKRLSLLSRLPFETQHNHKTVTATAAQTLSTRADGHTLSPGERAGVRVRVNIIQFKGRHTHPWLQQILLPIQA